jgi:hypothetical protein
MNKKYVFLNPKIFAEKIKEKNDKMHGFSFYSPGCSNNIFIEKDFYCAICLNKFAKEIARPEACDHIFCSKCLIYWSKTKKICPLCRRIFNTIIEINN